MHSNWDSKEACGESPLATMATLVSTIHGSGRDIELTIFHLAPDGGFLHFSHIGHLITEKIFRPILNTTIEINIQFCYTACTRIGIYKVGSDIGSMDLIFSYPSLETPEEVL